MRPALHRRRATFIVAVMAVLGVGCWGSVSQRPPRNAETVSRALLAGQWVGTYRSQTVNRDGKLRLIVEQRGDSLAGWLDLIGIPPEPGRAAPVAGGDSVRVPIPSITLDGVRARFHSASYWDPGCGCALRLEVTGFVVADTLGGYYDAIGTALMATGEGRWRAVRVR